MTFDLETWRGLACLLIGSSFYAGVEIVFGRLRVDTFDIGCFEGGLALLSLFFFTVVACGSAMFMY